MKYKKLLSFITFILLFVIHTFCFADEKDQINVERYSDRVLIVRSGKVYFGQVVAFASNKGLVMIDTGVSPTLTAKYRKIIEKEFGRDDFIYVINTHYHFDHTSGNQVFPEVKIIGHEDTPAGMMQFKKNLPNFIKSRKARLSQRKEQLKTMEQNSEGAQRTRDLIHTSSYMIKDLENNFVLTPPTLTFSDRMQLDLGDLTLNLVHFGKGLHTGDDVLIHCPEEKLLFTGDLFYKESFQMTYSANFDAPRWIKALDLVLAENCDIDFAFDAHNGRMTGEFICLWRDYLADLWEKINWAKKQEWDFEQVQKDYSFDKEFSYIKKSGIEVEALKRQHQNNLQFFWYRVNESKSAAAVLNQIMDNKGIEAVIKKYKNMKSEPTDKFFFSENEFNQLGYRLLSNNQLQGAIEIFKINVTEHPDSWNVYDSLGEGYMTIGEKELAIKHYQKSLELNPDNENGKMMLKKLLN